MSDYDFSTDIREIEEELGKRFELVPTVTFSLTNSEPRNGCREDAGVLTDAFVRLPEGLRRHTGLMMVIARHEIRENLLVQHYAGAEEAHEYALGKEALDIIRYGVDPGWYEAVKDLYEVSIDPDFFGNLPVPNL